MYRLHYICAAVLALHVCTPAQDTPKVEFEMSKPLPRANALGTAGYKATEKEAVFEKKVTEKPVDFSSDFKLPRPQNLSDAEWEKIQKDLKGLEDEPKKTAPAKEYSLIDQAGQFAGWFGIVRQASWDEKKGVTTLLLEHKYFDGLTDLHIHIVSIYGGGDFKAVLPRKVTSAEIPPLSLVRVYGKVSKSADGMAELSVEYARVWDWGNFTFMSYGKDKTNPKWTAQWKKKGDDAYDSRPNTQYYEEWLGKRETGK